MKAIHFLTFGFTMFIILVVILADAGKLPEFLRIVYDIPNGDKVGHLVLMGILSLLANLSLRSRTVPVGRWKLWMGSLLVTLVVTLEEVTQLFFVTRSFSLLDLSTDYLGIWIFGAIASLLVRSQTL